MIYINNVEQIVISVPFVHQQTGIKETLQCRYSEIGKVVRVLFCRDENGTEHIEETIEGNHKIDLSDDQQQRGVRVRYEQPWEWLDRVHEGALPISDGPDGEAMTATQTHERYPHLDPLLEEMRQQILEQTDPNLRRAARAS